MIVPGTVNTFLLEILQGIHQPTDVYRLALYTKDADLSPDTEGYTTEGEVFGQGYGAGGLTLSAFQAALEDRMASIDWADPTWPNATITARAGLIYNYSKGNRAVVVLDFGENVSSTNGSFMVTLPEPVVRIGE